MLVGALMLIDCARRFEVESVIRLEVLASGKERVKKVERYHEA